MSSYIPTNESLALRKRQAESEMAGYTSPDMNGYIPADRIANSRYSEPDANVNATRGINGDPSQAQQYNGTNGPMRVNYMSGDYGNPMQPVRSQLNNTDMEYGRTTNGVDPTEAERTLAVSGRFTAPVDNNALAESAASKVEPTNDISDTDTTTVDDSTQNAVEADPDNNKSFLDFFRPEQGEIDAANQGQRWHWALEHRTMLPQTYWSEMVQKNVPLEGQLIQNNNNGAKLSGTTFRTLFSMQDKFIKEVDKGNWLNELNGVNPNDLDSSIDELKNTKLDQYKAYRSNLEQLYNEFENGNSAEAKVGALEIKHLVVDLDRAYKPFLASWTNEDKKAIGNVYQLEAYTNNLIDFANKNYNPKTGQWLHPYDAQQFQGDLNNLIDYKLKVSTGSGSNLADSAKIRELHSWLSPTDTTRAMAAMSGYQRYLSYIMSKSTDQSLRGSIEQWLNAVQALNRSVKGGGGNDYNKFREEYADASSKLSDVLEQIEKTGNTPSTFNNTYDAGAAAAAAEQAYSTYLQQLTFGAGLNVPALLNSAEMAVKSGYDSVNKQLGHYQRRGMGNYSAKDISGVPKETNGPNYAKIEPGFSIATHNVHSGSESVFPKYEDLDQAGKDAVDLKYGKGAVGRAKYEAARDAARKNHI